MSEKTKNLLLVAAIAVIAYMLFADHKEAKQQAALPLGASLPGSPLDWWATEPNAFVPMGSVNDYPSTSGKLL